MSMIPDDVIEQVRDAADIVGIIGEHVDLKRTGADYRGPCPFHGGSHRNLAVIPKKQMFYCFVCHESGDVFSFLMKHLGMEYPTAVRDVAARCGISIPERPMGGPDPLEPWYTAVSVASEWYARCLRESDQAQAARAYLEGRRFDLTHLAPRNLGFAPPGTAMLDAMGRLGITPDVMLDAGLAVRREDGSVRPRFWNRLLFPIHDIRGRVVGFGGRLLGDGEPKYLNSPDSRIFHKGRLLYNLHEAKHTIRKTGRALVVEGYFDVLRLAEAGIEEVVAPLGTSLTEDQARLLKRYTQEVVVLYDSDRAGLRATFRAADELLRAGLRVTVVTLPPGEDPDTLVRDGGVEAINTVLDDGIDVLERKLQLLERSGWLGTLAGRRRALDRLLPTLRAAADPVTRDLYATRTAEALGISPESVRREADARAVRQVRSAPSRDRTGEATTGRVSSPAWPERTLLRVAVHAPQWRAAIAGLIRDRTDLHEPERGLIELAIGVAPETPVGELLLYVEGEARLVLQSALDEGLGERDVDAMVSGAVDRLDSRVLAERKQAITRQLTVAGEKDEIELLREKAALTKESQRLKTAEWNVLRRGGS